MKKPTTPTGYEPVEIDFGGGNVARGALTGSLTGSRSSILPPIIISASLEGPMLALPTDQQSFHLIAEDKIVAGLWDNDGVRHYALFQRVRNFAPVAGSS